MNDPVDVRTLLEREHRPWWRRGAAWLLLALLLALATGGWVWRQQARTAAAPRYVTQPVTRGDLAVTVTATGTLQPTRSVAVGSELSGTVARVLVDVNDPVHKGQLLVELDRARLADAVAGARAERDAARARRQQAEVTLREARAGLARLEELARLSGGKAPATGELDAAHAAAARAAAELDAASAAEQQAATAVSSSETSLSKAAIRSPIDGIVLSRTVEPGNAVAASLQAVTLFTLAEDLASMKLSVNVDEADVAQVRTGQSARFTVAAHPGRDYPARVSRVAFGSTTTDNVVTYTTQLDVDNADLSLRPGMTATATIATRGLQAVLLVPNSALRFAPVAAADGGSSASLVSRLLPRPPGSGRTRRPADGGPATGSAAPDATVWVLRDGQPAPLRVRRGLTDGRRTEVSGPGLSEGLAVIVDQST